MVRGGLVESGGVAQERDLEGLVSGKGLRDGAQKDLMPERRG